MNAVINAKDISKGFKFGNSVVQALGKTNLIVYKGDIIVILGKSGSGKSTLLNILGGLEKPDSGEVYINKKGLYKTSENKRTEIRREEIGFIFQSFNLVDELSLLENLRLPFDIMRKKYDVIYERQVITMLDLKKRLKFYPQQLSGGEKQRAAIARALISKASIILCDEPNGNIDTEASNRLMQFIKRTNFELKQTFVIVTHDTEWRSIANRILHMQDGILVEEVTNYEYNSAGQDH